MSSVSSGAQVALPQAAVPPAGSMPMPEPQVRNRRTRWLRGTKLSLKYAPIRPSSAVSRVSPARRSGAREHSVLAGAAGGHGRSMIYWASRPQDKQSCDLCILSNWLCAAKAATHERMRAAVTHRLATEYKG